MKLIYSPASGGKLYSVRTRGARPYIFYMILLLVLISALVGGGYWVGVQYGHRTLISEWKQDVGSYSERVRLMQVKSAAELDALTTKLAELQSHVDRLDALGNKLVVMADLEDAEFDFGQRPGVGGPDTNMLIEPGSEPLEPFGVEAALQAMAVELSDREDQLLLLDSVIANRNIRKEVYPQGRPVAKGWVSSHFGKRRDPFSGKQDYHNGVDIAGKAGSDVVAVAGGVVTDASSRSGYGKLVEIDHGNGFVTRYGHNKSVTVSVGQVIKKGEVIAKMGSTGRSTGPHVHFEVLKNGQRVNPMKYIQATR